MDLMPHISDDELGTDIAEMTEGVRAYALLIEGHQILSRVADRDARRSHDLKASSYRAERDTVQQTLDKAKSLQAARLAAQREER